MHYLEKLLAQRAHFITTFYANRQNVEDNRNRLIASARQLANSHHPFFANHDVNGAVAMLEKGVIIPRDQSLLSLQLYAIVHQKSQATFDCLFQSSTLLSSSLPSSRLSLHCLAPKLALCLQIDDKPLSTGHHETLLNNQLLVCYYRQQFSVIEAFSSEHNGEITLLTRLYLNVFIQPPVSNALLLIDFIQLEYLESELFELYVVSLDVKTLLALVNQLAADQQHIALLIKVMALSGYSRFIPFLARYLQDTSYTANAHHALRILLGDKLDTLIPNYIQFNSDELQRIEDLRYYGAKILHHWDESLLPSLGPRLLSGLPVNKDNLDFLLKSGSQAHRRVAALHQSQFPNNGEVYYYSQPGLVL